MSVFRKLATQLEVDAKTCQAAQLDEAEATYRVGIALLQALEEIHKALTAPPRAKQRRQPPNIVVTPNIVVPPAPRQPIG